MTLILGEDCPLQLDMSCSITLPARSYGLADGNQYFEIDVYPFWSDQAIMEIELSDPNEEIRFPEIIRVIREVTEDERYKNSSLAKL